MAWSEWAEYTANNVAKIGDVYGVYLLCVSGQNNDARVFYVGSGNIVERLQAHLSTSEHNLCIKTKLTRFKCFFAYMEVQGGEETRKNEEQRLIDQYRKTGGAECNEVEAVER